MSERPAWWQRLERIDRRWIFLVMFLAVSWPILFRVPLPITATPEVNDYFTALDTLKAGDVVFFPADYDPGTQAELRPMMLSSLHHLFRKDVKVICFTLWETGPNIVDQILREGAEAAGAEYGVDYVYLGYKAGREVIMAQVAQSISGIFPQDYFGRPIRELPLMQRVDRLTDTKLIVNISSGYPGTKEWVQQVRTRFDVPMVSGCTGVSAPEYYPYYQSGQLSGLLGGLGGAARYEALLGRPGPATAGMSSQSMGHLAVIAFIVMGNIFHLLGRRRRGGRR